MNTSPANARRHARVRIRMIRSNLGDLRDLSISGARLLCRGLFAPGRGSHVRLVIDGMDGEVEVDAVVKWGCRTGMFSHEIGLEFVEVTPRVRAALTLVARSAPQNDVYSRAEERRRSA
jgi:hypothetical protein